MIILKRITKRRVKIPTSHKPCPTFPAPDMLAVTRGGVAGGDVAVGAFVRVLDGTIAGAGAGGGDEAGGAGAG